MALHCTVWGEIFMICCCCLPPARQGGGITYLAITITHLLHHSDISQIVLEEILPRTALNYISVQSFLSLALSLSSPLLLLALSCPVTGSVFHHFYRFGLEWDSPEGWWGPNWKFWFRKLQSSGSFGNLVISEIVKNVNIKVSVHLSSYTGTG